MDRITETTIGAARVGILGDPHLGRTFIRGVPLDKRCLREGMVSRDFRQRLENSGRYDVHICTGDLFDRWAVPYVVVFEAAWAYLAAARSNPETRYFVLAGNHDISRDLERKGALDLFELIVSRCQNVFVVRHGRGALLAEMGGVKVGFFPFHPITPAAELVTEEIDVAFGHWDTICGHDNMVPTERFAEVGCRTVYTGHVHLPDEFTRDGVKVVQVGSMQPYAHGEDTGEMYVTLRPEELEGTDLRDKCVRVLLNRGEPFDQQVDCLQLSFKRVGDNEDDAVEEVSMGEFDLMALFSQAFEEAGVPQTVREKLVERFEEARIKE